MIDVRVEVGQALIGNVDLVNLLGGEHIHQIRAPNAKQLPRITFFEMTNSNSDFADNVPIASEIHMQIDIWCKFEQIGSVPALMGEVEVAMKGAGFTLTTTSPDLWEEDTQVFHKALRFKIKKGTQV